MLLLCIVIIPTHDNKLTPRSLSWIIRQPSRRIKLEDKKVELSSSESTQQTTYSTKSIDWTQLQLINISTGSNY